MAIKSLGEIQGGQDEGSTLLGNSPEATHKHNWGPLGSITRPEAHLSFGQPGHPLGTLRGESIWGEGNRVDVCTAGFLIRPWHDAGAGLWAAWRSCKLDLVGRRRGVEIWRGRKAGRAARGRQ